MYANQCSTGLLGQRAIKCPFNDEWSTQLTSWYEVQFQACMWQSKRNTHYNSETLLYHMTAAYNSWPFHLMLFFSVQRQVLRQVYEAKIEYLTGSIKLHTRSTRKQNLMDCIIPSEYFKQSLLTPKHIIPYLHNELHYDTDHSDTRQHWPTTYHCGCKNHRPLHD